MDHPISNALKSQIKKWQWYSITAPVGFLTVAGIVYFQYGTPFDNLFYLAVIVFSITCVVWWHWCLITMGTMLQIMSETDKHFSKVSNDLNLLAKTIEEVNKKKRFSLFDN